MSHIAIGGNELAAWPIPEDLGKTESENGRLRKRFSVVEKVRWLMDPRLFAVVL